MGMFIDLSDLAPFADIDEAKAEAMIADAEALAILAAPCLPGLLVAPDGETPEGAAIRQAKLNGLLAILRGAILRWDEAGTGAISQRSHQMGPFGQSETIDTRQTRKAMYWPSEIEALQALCQAGVKSGKAFAVDTIPGGQSAHLPWCSLMFGARYCSCGVDIAGVPIFEGGTP